MPHPTEPYYTPPDFPVYEFDDSRLVAEGQSDGTRWLSGLGGRIGDPAHDVQLSWRMPRAAQVLVCSTRAHPSEAPHLRRSTALFQIDNRQFYDPGPPLRPAVAGWDHIDSLADDGAIWHQGEVMIDEEPARSELTEIAGCWVGHAAVGDVLVYFVHRGLGDGPFALRRLTRPTYGYRIDPAEPQTVVELEREWEEFFRDRPDLDPEQDQPRPGLAGRPEEG
ncbi:MAG: hypothetical protein ABI112_08355 [Terracoccus sp.]